MYAQQLADASWQTELVVTVGQGDIWADSDAPLALDSNDRPYIAYYAYHYLPTLASRNSGAWQTEVIEPSYLIARQRHRSGHRRRGSTARRLYLLDQ